MNRRIAALAVAVGLVAALSACAPVGDGIPVDVPPDIGTGTDDPVAEGVPPECAEPFPSAMGELADADGIVPADWPDPPFGAVLCVVLVSGDASAVLHYVTPRQDVYAVLDHYEVALQEYAFAGWEFERSEEDPDRPSLAVRGPELEFSIQTDAGTATYLVAFERLS